MSSRNVTVRVEGQQLRLSNLDKVLYPAVGFTKGEVIDYYTRIAPVLLPHLADRPLTLRRFPDGVVAASFWNKDASRNAPSWLRLVRVPTPGSSLGNEYIDFAVLDGLPAVVWAANLAGIELHVPQWTVGPRGAVREPDLLVFDLDPGPPATIVDCCWVALRLRAVLAEDGLPAFPKTSGSKGMQVYAPVRVSEPGRTSRYARAVADRLAGEHPGQVLSQMSKVARKGKVFVDWSQNNTAKTTVAPYSLRARDEPTVSTPLTWDEVESCTAADELVFTAAGVLDRVSEHGDLLGPLHERHIRLPRRR